jgi:hypothetical protein
MLGALGIPAYVASMMTHDASATGLFVSRLAVITSC